MAGLLLIGADLYTEPSGRVVCRTHAERPTDIWRWERLSLEEAAEWRAFIAGEYGAGVSPCEDCRIAEGFYR